MIPLTFCAIAFRIALTVWVLSIPTFTGPMVTPPSYLAACWTPLISSTK